MDELLLNLLGMVRLLGMDEILKAIDEKGGSEVKSTTFNKEKGVTTVVLKDGRKGLAKVANEDVYDEKVGFALAYCYAIFGSKTQFNKKVASLQK